MKLAILSPSQSSYSESFVQAHKLLSDKPLFYYGGLVPEFLEGCGPIVGRGNLRIRVRLYLLFHPSAILFYKKFSTTQKVLATSLRENRITHVLAEFGNCAASVMDVCDYLGIKLIAHFHGYEISRYSVIEQYKEKYRTLFKVSTAVIVVSHLMEEKLLEMGCGKEKIIYSPCGPNECMLDCNPKFQNNNILFIGRFVEKKAPEDLINAFNIVLRTIPDATLTMIGDGPMMDLCKHLASILHIESRISFLGPVNHNDIYRYYNDASVYVQPSVTASDGDQEGTPVSVMEASLAGLPVVATLHAGIPDVLIDGESAFLVAEHDVDALANNIVTVLKDKNHARMMGAYGREIIKKDFILSVSLGKIKRILD